MKCKENPGKNMERLYHLPQDDNPSNFSRKLCKLLLFLKKEMQGSFIYFFQDTTETKQGQLWYDQLFKPDCD